jgi:hypothetical protein
MNVLLANWAVALLVFWLCWPLTAPIDRAPAPPAAAARWAARGPLAGRLPPDLDGAFVLVPAAADGRVSSTARLPSLLLDLTHGELAADGRTLTLRMAGPGVWALPAAPSLGDATRGGGDGADDDGRDWFGPAGRFWRGAGVGALWQLRLSRLLRHELRLTLPPACAAWPALRCRRRPARALAVDAVAFGGWLPLSRLLGVAEALHPLADGAFRLVARGRYGATLSPVVTRQRGGGAPGRLLRGGALRVHARGLAQLVAAARDAPPLHFAY